MNVLFVCTGNVCRSPMAEGFLRLHAATRGLDIDVRSTGTHAWEGRAATWDGRRVMAELECPIEEHRTLALTGRLVDWADLILGLSTEHVAEVTRLYPQAGGRTFTLKEFVRLLPALPPFEDTKSWLSAASEAQRETGSGDMDDYDVDDPFGERQEAYRRVANEIKGLIDELARGFEDKRLLAGQPT
jgi:protein-tyrosine-phosphatase